MPITLPLPPQILDNVKALQAKLNGLNLISQSWYSGFAFCLGNLLVCVDPLDPLAPLGCRNFAICVEKYVAELAAYPDVARLVSLLVSYFQGGSPMAGQCVQKHSGGMVPGAGLCCAQVGVGLTPPPPGTKLAPYVAGQADAGQIPAGRIVQVTDAGGHCASCMIVGSTSKKHPGKPVLKFVRGGPLCPTAGTGCCSL
jgi:hypothetical protein